MNWLRKLTSWICSVVGYDVRYKLQFRRHGRDDLGALARRIGEYERLVNERRLSINIWWGWTQHREGAEALDMVHRLWDHYGFFLLKGDAKVRVADGTVYERPKRVPANADVVTLTYNGRLPIPSEDFD